MAKVTNLDELKRQHEWARIAKVGSRDWIEFSSTMIDSFPALYETAKRMNAEFEQLRQDKARLDWLTEEMADTIYLDDGRIIDIGGGSKPHDVRFAIDTLKTPNPEFTGAVRRPRAT